MLVHMCALMHMCMCVRVYMYEHACMCVCDRGGMAIVCGFHCRMICLGHSSRLLPDLIRFQGISGFCLERVAMHWHQGLSGERAGGPGIQCVSSLIVSLPFSIPGVLAIAQFLEK